MASCYLNTGAKKDCTGCGACKAICPKNAITMVSDEEGYKYPHIDTKKCINCGLCRRICPVTNEIPDIYPKAYTYVTNDESNLFEATSGGAFGDIVNAVFEEGKTYVYGCTFDENHKAVHAGVNSREKINQFKRSKYVQSDLKETFKEVRDLLAAGYKVIFSGTPCQTAGLKSFLKGDCANLLCIDIICHGVPSQKLLDYYINIEEKKNNSKLNKIVFREKSKEKDGSYSLTNVKLFFSNGEKVLRKASKSSYMTGFSGRLFYRPSCYNCKFASKNRLSDITICDIWGLKNLDKEIYGKGISGIIINSAKGEEVLNKLNGIIKDIPIEHVIKTNECYTRPSYYNKNRNKFFNGLSESNFEKKAFKYAKKPLINRIILFPRKVLGYIKRFILKCIK